MSWRDRPARRVGRQRRWPALAAGVVAVATLLTWTAVSASTPRSACGCALPPHLDGTDDTAARWVAAVRAGDGPTAWALLTPEAQRRHGDVAALRAELPALAERFRSPEADRWLAARVWSGGAGTPSQVAFVLLSYGGGRPTAVSALVVHTLATRADPGRVDPDLGAPVGIRPPDGGTALALPGWVRLTGLAGGSPAFAAVPTTGATRQDGDGGLTVPLDGPPSVEAVHGDDYLLGATRTDLPRSTPHRAASKPSGLLIVLVKHADGRIGYGAARAHFATPSASGE